VSGAVGVIGLAVAWAAEPVAVITEIGPGSGELGVQLAGESNWKPPQPLQALRPGDQMRVAGDGRLVVVFTGGRGVTVVSQANSPFVIEAPVGAPRGQRVGTLLDDLTRLLLGQYRDVTYRPLRTRDAQPLPRILSPRETRLLPGPPRFEWAGPDHLRYDVRVFGPHGLVWDRLDLPRRPQGYPTGAPGLEPGVRYVWELAAKGHPVQRAWFQVLAPPEATRVQSDLALLQSGAVQSYPRGTLSAMRAGVFIREGLFHDARRELMAGIVIDPEEPTLHLLLGGVYERTGLTDLAGEAYAEAQSLLIHRR
jgi:hypothetical protein